MEYYKSLSNLINEYTRQYWLLERLKSLHPNKPLETITITYLYSDDYPEAYNEISLNILQELEKVKQTENKESLIMSLNESLSQVSRTYEDYRLETPIDEIEANNLGLVRDNLLNGYAITEDEGIRLLNTTVAMRFSVHCLQVMDLINIELAEIERNIVITGRERYIIAYEKIEKSHKEFNGVLFEDISLKDYLTCWDLNNCSSSNLKYLEGKKIQFLEFLYRIKYENNGIVTNLITNEIAKRFGENFYKSKKGKFKSTPIFNNQCNRILK